MVKVVFLILALISTDPREISKVNSLKKNAAEAFKKGNFEKAIEQYQILDSLGVEDPALKLNLAHAFYQLNDTTGALNNYQAVLNAPNKKLRSVAYQQLGVMKKETQKYEEALQYLKSSLKADPTNEGARYDYELVKKLLEEQKKQEQEQQDQNQEDQDQENQDQNQDQENKDEQKGDKDQEQEQQDGEKEESDQEEDGEKKEGENEEGEEQEAEKEPSQEEMMQEKLEEMNISPEKAKMILEAMRNNEVQYLQQQRRKPTKRPPSGKPDW